MKKLSLFICISLISFSTLGALTGKVIDLLMSESNILAVVGKTSFNTEKSNAAKVQIELSLKALIGEDKIATRENILRAIANAAEEDKSSQNRAFLQSLTKKLTKDINDVSENDVVGIMNDLITLAGVRSSLVTACSECALGPLASEGIAVTLKKVTNRSVLGLLETNVIPKTKKKLRNYIKSGLKRFELGKLKNSPEGLVKMHERKSLAIFLGLAKKHSSATPAQRKYIKAVFKFSATAPKGENKILLNADNPHKLWNIFSDPSYTDSTIGELAEVISKAADKADKDGLINKADAFYDELDNRAKSITDVELRAKAIENANAIRANKCLVGK